MCPDCFTGREAILATTALVLAGHGSHISPQTAGLVWKHVDSLRAANVADEVTAAFWKEAPSFHRVFDALTATDITVVPLFTAQGYFTQTVIPTEMGLSGPITHSDGRILRYARTLSEHPYLSKVVHQRVRDALAESAAPAAKTAVAIIGHSTRRNPESRRATEAQANLLREAGIVGEVVAVYLDDSPSIAEVYDLTSAPNLIAVPYFLALGSHTTQDVPADLALEPGRTTGRVRERDVYYTPPVGIDEALQDVILELARDTGAALRSPQRAGSAWDCFAAAGRDDLLVAVQQAGILQFGQLQLTLADVRAHDGDLQVIHDPTTLRAFVRDNPFRPLATSTDLPGGWRVPITHPEMIHAVVETVYPGAVADWSAYRRDMFGIETLDRTAARQTGMYHALGALDSAQRANIVARVCSRCVRHPTWFDGSPSAIPCGEACNVWMSAALESKE
jgi:sirohydrochlorin cobaltochelatase